MISVRVQSDIRRLCNLELPAPAVSAALAPLFRELIGCELSSFARIAPDGRLINFGMSDRPPTGEVMAIYADRERTREMERTASDDIWTFLRSGQKVQSTAGFMKDLIRSPLYEQVFIPQGIHQAARVPLFAGAHPVGFALVARAPGGRAFHDRETGRLVAMAPWLAHAMASNADGMMGDLLADEGTAILDAAGRVQFHCPDGGRLLNMLRQPHGLNVPADTVWLDRLLFRLARQCGATLAGRPALPPAWRGATPWGGFSLRVAPLQNETRDPPRLFALRLQRRIDRALGVATALARHHGLSPRQKDVCLALAQGLDRNRIAARLGLRVSTVITHTREIYARLGAENREDMVRILLSENGQPQAAWR